MINLAGGPGPFTLNSAPTFGIRWIDLTQGAQSLSLTFYSNVDTSAGSTNALATATQLNAITYSLPVPAATGSYVYSLTFPANFTLLTASNTIGVEVTLANTAGTAFSTAIGGRLSTGTPSVGTNDGFLYQDSDGAFAGSERTQAIGTVSGTPVRTNYRFVLDAVPEPGAVVMFSLGAGLFALGFARRRLAVG